MNMPVNVLVLVRECACMCPMNVLVCEYVLGHSRALMLSVNACALSLILSMSANSQTRS